MLDVLTRISRLSPEKLAALSHRLRQEKLEYHRLIPRRADRGKPAAVSFAQERLWFLHQIEPGSLAYNIVGAVDLAGSLDVLSLRSAVKEIVRRHEVLRTGFVEADGKPLQVISENATVEIERDVLESEEPAFIDAWMTQKLRKHFDLTCAPLLRVYLGSIHQDRHILLTIMHHIVSDGPSMNIYFQELIEIYGRLREQGHHELPDLQVQYSDFSVWQRERISEAFLTDEIAYWKKRLEGVADLPPLVTDYPRAQGGDQQLAFHTVELSPTHVETFKALASQKQTTPFVGFLAVFQIVLYHFTGVTDVVIGSPVTGRTRRELERVIGLFASLHILRTDLTGDPDFSEILGRTRRGVMEVQDHQEVPFQRIIEELQPVRRIGQMPLFQVSFTYFSDFEQLPQVPGLSVAPIKTSSGVAMYDLDLNLIQRQGALTATLEYKKALFDAGTIGGLIRSFNVAMTAVTQNPDVRLSQICGVLKKAEEDRALELVKEREQKLRARLENSRRKALQIQARKTED